MSVPSSGLDSFAEQWESFAEAAIPLNASADQRRDMRRAFYGGALILLYGILELGSEAYTEDSGAAQLAKWQQEIEGVANEIIQGRD